MSCGLGFIVDIKEWELLGKFDPIPHKSQTFFGIA
jgi:hypothetical protein